jgi:hypothetical protein
MKLTVEANDAAARFLAADPREHEHVRAWLGPVEGTEGFVNDRAPVPARVTERALAAGRRIVAEAAERVWG